MYVILTILIVNCTNMKNFLFAKSCATSLNLRLHNCANADHAQFAAEVERYFKQIPYQNLQRSLVENVH